MTSNRHPRLVDVGRASANTALAPDIHALNQARKTAATTRSRFLIAVLHNQLKAVDAPWVACDSGERPLLRVRLVQLLATTPRWEARRTNAAVGHIAELLGQPVSEVHDADLAWLADRRSAGRRVLAWLDAFRPRTTPWPGFPYAPIPDEFSTDGPGQPPLLAPRNRQGTLR